MGKAGAMTVLVVTDSAATVPPDLTEQLGIVVVPIRIIVGERSYPDGALSHRELLDSADRVSTSGPSPGDFVQAIEGRASGDGVVVVTVSHDMGESTFLAARAAAAVLDVPVQVVDSATAAGGQGLVVLEAARVASNGGSMNDVVAAVEHVMERVRLVATLPGLDHLARSGHVPEAGAWAARWIGLRPVIELQSGRVRPLRPALSAGAALDRLMDVWRDSKPAERALLHLGVLHALDPEGGRELAGRVAAELEPATMFIGSFGTAMVVHSGPGVLGLAWWWDDGS